MLSIKRITIRVQNALMENITKKIILLGEERLQQLRRMGQSIYEQVKRQLVGHRRDAVAPKSLQYGGRLPKLPPLGQHQHASQHHPRTRWRRAFSTYTLTTLSHLDALIVSARLCDGMWCWCYDWRWELLRRHRGRLSLMATLSHAGIRHTDTVGGQGALRLRWTGQC